MSRQLGSKPGTLVLGVQTKPATFFSEKVRSTPHAPTTNAAAHGHAPLAGAGRPTATTPAAKDESSHPLRSLPRAGYSCPKLSAQTGGCQSGADGAVADLGERSRVDPAGAATGARTLGRGRGRDLGGGTLVALVVVIVVVVVVLVFFWYTQVVTTTAVTTNTTRTPHGTEGREKKDAADEGQRSEKKQG